MLLHLFPSFYLLFFFIFVCKWCERGWVHGPTTFISFPLPTAEALAAQVTQENFDGGLIYPPFTNIRKISAHIAAKVAAKAYELGEFLADMLGSLEMRAIF